MRSDAARAASADIDVWINESFVAAQNTAYASPPINRAGGASTLTDGYTADALKLARGRIALAGVRLANLLKAAFRQ
jgi:S1/P1 Nuclease